METTTKNGQRVIVLKYVPFNSCGNKVTYPIKGYIVRKEKPFRVEYAIWSIDGRKDIVYNTQKWDDIEVPEGLVP